MHEDEVAVAAMAVSGAGANWANEPDAARLQIHRCCARVQTGAISETGPDLSAPVSDLSGHRHPDSSPTRSLSSFRRSRCSARSRVGPMLPIGMSRAAEISSYEGRGSATSSRSNA